MNLTPAFTVSVAGDDRSDVLRSRLQHLRISDHLGGEADEIELEFDDRLCDIALPAHGAQLDVAIGFEGSPLVRVGVFVVDEVEIVGPPDTIGVRGRSADFRGSLKAQKNRAFRGMTLGTVVGQIAGEQGLQPQVHPSLAGLTIAHRDQAGESDLHFLTRLGRTYDAVASVKAGRLIFAPRGQAVSASGQGLTALTFDRSDLTSWRALNGDRAKHGKVRARHRDAHAAADVYEEAGDSDPVKTLRHVYPDAPTASAAAHAEHRRLKRLAHGVTLFCPGRPEAFAGVPIELTGLRDGLNGRWIASLVEHEIDMRGAGFTTRIDATIDGLSADTDDGSKDYGGDDADPAAGEGGGT